MTAPAPDFDAAREALTITEFLEARIAEEVVDAGAKWFIADVEITLASHNLNVEAGMAAQAMRNFAEAWQAGIDDDIAAHPDLMEVDVTLDGFYGSQP